MTMPLGPSERYEVLFPVVAAVPDRLIALSSETVPRYAIEAVIYRKVDRALQTLCRFQLARLEDGEETGGREVFQRDLQATLTAPMSFSNGETLALMNPRLLASQIVDTICGSMS